MSDLFGFEAPIAWDERGMRGATRDGRVVSIEVSTFSSRFVATIPLHGKDVVTRRSEKTAEEARAAAEKAVRETAT